LNEELKALYAGVTEGVAGAAFDRILGLFGGPTRISDARALRLEEAQTAIAKHLRAAAESFRADYTDRGSRLLGERDALQEALLATQTNAVILCSVKRGRSTLKRCRRAIAAGVRGADSAWRGTSDKTPVRKRIVEGGAMSHWARFRVSRAKSRLDRAADKVERNPRYLTQQ
jgi:hypothetical protein